ncbi:MAG TPA: phospholipase D-like domain-containing protein, partial [Candidatus Polarisedimenticolaceae bacterium]|nr:phospholipase D-like domain-containing protein [Candidatus Polarisedimenticolaceae bacterium]
MRGEGVQVRVESPSPLNLMRRLVWNHRKMVLVDPDIMALQRAFIGGVQPTAHNAGWHDFAVEMSGDMMNCLAGEFNSTWDKWGTRGVSAYSGGLVVADVPGHGILYPLTLRLIRRAARQVIIESPYLQGRHLWRELARAALRDVDVSVIVPLNNHKQFGTPVGRVLDWAVHNGINVHRFTGTGGMTHARALLADDWVLFGSFPFNLLTAGRMGEIAIATPSASLVGQLRSFLADDITSSQLHVAR